MNRNTLVAVIVVAILVIGGGIFLVANKNSSSMDNMKNSSTSTTAAPSDAKETNSVTVQNYAFSPTDIKVKKGTTVTWTNQDTVKHTITADSGNGPKSELFGKGETYTYTFNTVGTFSYHCVPHPYMKGTVTVTE